MMKNRALCLAMLAFALSYVFFYGGKVPYVLLFAIAALITLSLDRKSVV
jgi:hypothetical protein